MTLGIDIDKVESVLLADGWHDVAHESFVLDAYEFRHEATMVHRGGQSGVTATGFTFEERDGRMIAGPLTAVLAVKTKK